MKGLAGNYFEIVVDEFLNKGTYPQCRKLGEPGAENNTDTFKEIQIKNAPFEVVDPKIKSLAKALQDGACNNANILYCFCKAFPVVDYAALDFQHIFQVTEASKHTINLNGILDVCNYVRVKYGNHAKVNLYFTIPSSALQVSDWQYTQSFKYVSETINAKGVHEMKEITQKFNSLPLNYQNQLSNLVQCVILCDLDALNRE